jgi:hypothetical protein
MEELLTLFLRYGWQICIAGLIGSILIGIIKTPIKVKVLKKLSNLPADSEAVKHTENALDTMIFLGTYVMSIGLAAAYLTLMNLIISFDTIISSSFQIWLVQNVVYGVWKKLGLKRILIYIIEGFNKAIISRLDKNKDGKVTFTEAAEALTGLIKNGKIEVSELLKMAEETSPGIVTEILENATKEEKESTKETSNISTSNVIIPTNDAKKIITALTQEAKLEETKEDKPSARKSNSAVKF